VKPEPRKKQRKPKAPITKAPEHWKQLDPTYLPDDAQSEADEDLRAYMKRVRMGLEQIPN
jgi:hypothetical protein